MPKTKTKTTTQTVHFTLGENAGALLMSIAQEHLIYNHSPQKAMDAILESLIGCPTDLAVKILRGDMVLPMDVEAQQFLCRPYDPETDKTVFPRLDIEYYVNRQTRDISESGKGLDTAINKMAYRMKNGSVRMEFNYDSILKFVQGDTADIIEQLNLDERVDDLKMLIEVTKAYIERSMQAMAIIHFMKVTWPEEFVNDRFADQIKTANERMRFVTEELSNLFKSDFGKAMRDSLELDSYVKSAIEIDAIVEVGIEPVDIMDNYSAGWLSPDGTFYGLNGEIANMLHNQIASALFDKGLIPNTEEYKVNPDNWLLGQGWVRIHKNTVLFEANLNERIDRGPNRYMTDTQIDMITNYCRLHHHETVKCTFQPISALSFQIQAKQDQYAFYRKYFLGD